MNKSTAAVRSGSSAYLVRPRLGFLGVGWIGRSRLEAIRRQDIGEIAAICDSDTGATGNASDIAPQAKVCRSLEALLDCDLDGVIIATPSAMHADQAVSALKRGLAVFCQKPLGTSGAEVRRVLDAAYRADRLLGVDLSYRHLNGMEEMRKRLQRGEIGKVFAAELVFHNAYGPDKAWYYDPATAGGGCVMDLGIHLVDLMLWLLDFPAAEFVSSRLLSNGLPMVRPWDRVEDYAAARIDLAGGITATLACSWNLPAGCDAVIRIVFYGTSGGLSLTNTGGSFFEFRAERFQKTARETIGEDSKESWWGKSAVEWVSRLTADGSYDPELEHMVQVADILDAIYGNSAAGPVD
jgi:predicted dehydrogenase